ncbi:MAG: L,D-transpeptidase family protein [Sedimentisphaerales bacterium]|nr:L,D-transpeptidase family protein [Sedimentisphaerales bacterium]
MARFFSNSRWSRKGIRLNSIILASAAVVFVVIVFLMFRGGSSGPREAVASSENGVPEPAEATRAVETRRATPRLAVVETNRPAGTATPQTPIPSQPEPTSATAQTSPLVAPPDQAPNGLVESIIAEGTALLQARPRKVIAARDKLNEAMSLPMSPEQRETVKQQLMNLSEEWLFGPAVFGGDTLCETYTVQPGDLLQVIGRKHKVPYQILMEINKIRRPEALQAGRTIKVINGPFHAKIYRSTFTLDLYLQGTYVRTFKVGLGKEGYETPTGLWRVREGGKLISPNWTDPDNPGRVYKATDPDYPLGSRWIALDGLEGAARDRTGFAIHGTKDPDQIGSAGSRGCIRMYNGDAVLMYNLLIPLYSHVEVFD